MIEGTSSHSCINPTYTYDEDEDMYSCNTCNYFFYPSEIGKSENAGYKHVWEQD